MEFISEVDFSSSAGLTLTPNEASRSSIFKIIGTGEMAAKGQDHHLLIRVNGEEKDYNSYVIMSGAHSAFEGTPVGLTGFYVGRNGYGEDAAFSFEYIISVDSNAQKITGSGTSVFAHGNRVLGYQSFGYFVSNPPISSIQVLLTGDVAVSGRTRLYRI